MVGLNQSDHLTSAQRGVADLASALLGIRQFSKRGNRHEARREAIKARDILAEIDEKLSYVIRHAR